MSPRVAEEGTSVPRRMRKHKRPLFERAKVIWICNDPFSMHTRVVSGCAVNLEREMAFENGEECRSIAAECVSQVSPNSNESSTRD